MTSMEFLEALGDLGDTYITEAHQKPRKRLSRRLPLLIAATLALLLAGCAAVYAVRAINLKIGTRNYSEPIYDTSMTLQGYTTGTRAVLTLSGLEGTAGYQAAQEWYEFLESYDPEYTIYYSVKGDIPEFPGKYAAFSPYTQEMADKIDEIAEKYGLSLPGSKLSAPSEKTILRAMGLDSVFTSAAESGELLSGSFYENGNFQLSFCLPSQEGWPYQTACTLFYTRHDSFSPWFGELDEGISWREWDYTTADGTEILIVRSDDSHLAWLFQDTADGFLAAEIEVSVDIYDDDAEGGVYSKAMSDKQLEAIADQINFAIAPTPVAAGTDLTDTSIDTSVQVQTVDGCTLELRSAQTDGRVVYITLGIISPEGTVLKDAEADIYTYIGTVNIPGLSKQLCSYDFTVDEGGEGNTGVLTVTVQNNDCTFAQNGSWTLYLEDMKGTQWVDGTEERLWTAEGNWQFTLDFSSSDTREIELLTDPIQVPATVGMALDGSDVYEEATISSIVLRAYSITIRFDGSGGSLGGYGEYIQVVLKDGTQIEVSDMLSASYTVGYAWGLADMSSPIPLDEAEKVILPGGQVLEVP